MPVPDFQTMMLPFLRLSQDQQEHSTSDVILFLANHYQLSENEIAEQIPSGYQTKLHNRVSWIFVHLQRAGLIEKTRRGFYKITNRGNELLGRNLARIDLNTLKQFPEYVEFRKVKRAKETNANPQVSEDEVDKTPEESLEIAYQTIQSALAAEIIEKVKSCSPAFFERLVVELLVKMGYGGTLQEAPG